MKISFWGCTVLALIATGAQAQTCDALIGQTITVTTFEEATKAIPTVEPKGEFETTAQFEARKASAAQGAPTGPMFVEIIQPDGLGHLKYDADKGQFEFNEFAFNASYFSTELERAYTSPFRSTDYRSRLLGVRLDADAESLGEYEATNGFGAKTIVKKRHQTNFELVEGSTTGSVADSQFFPRPRDGSALDKIGELVASPTDAQEAKPHLRAGVMFVPKAPYYVEVESAGRSPTRDLPYDVTYTTKALIGDMKCGVIYDDRTKTVAWTKATY